MPEAVPQIFNEYKVQMEQLINTTTIIQDKIAETEVRIDEKIIFVMSMADTKINELNYNEEPLEKLCFQIFQSYYYD